MRFILTGFWVWLSLASLQYGLEISRSAQSGRRGVLWPQIEVPIDHNEKRILSCC
jgi:hypothetical protein